MLSVIGLFGFESPRLHSMRPSKPFGFEGLTRGRPFDSLRWFDLAHHGSLMAGQLALGQQSI
jgi:hypothetical protein